ncbi:hypothetical protein C8R44DRAFT_725906 [Mycena epipterygia]|nr:hypothetical protein C8R44DRAFT_725906 [Mycena epipterygia]
MPAHFWFRRLSALNLPKHFRLYGTAARTSPTPNSLYAEAACTSLIPMSISLKVDPVKEFCPPPRAIHVLLPLLCVALPPLRVEFIHLQVASGLDTVGKLAWYRQFYVATEAHTTDKLCARASHAPLCFVATHDQLFYPARWAQTQISIWISASGAERGLSPNVPSSPGIRAEYVLYATVLYLSVAYFFHLHHISPDEKGVPSRDRSWVSHHALVSTNNHSICISVKCAFHLLYYYIQQVVTARFAGRHPLV